MSRLRRLIVEVHERSLWQALLVYLGASFAVLEAVDLFIDYFALPRWLFPVAFTVLVVGLVLVVVASLAREEVYGDEVPPEHTEAAAAEDRRLRVLTWRNAAASFVVALAVWGVVAAGWMVVHGPPAPSVDRKSVAVLPLANMSANPDDQYFTDGIHDAIIEHLAKIGDLKVISRTSVMEYRNTTKNIRQVAEELGVTTVLEGGVQRASGQVKITAQLVAAQTDESLWAESYERDLTAENVFAIQGDVARQIAAALHATLTPAESERIDKQPTQNLEAYEYYLRAVEVRREVQARAVKVELLERAVELDSNFALAYAELSNAHTEMFWQQVDRSQERLALAKRAVDKALELDFDLAEAHWALAFYYAQSGDQGRAASAREEALRLDPNSVRAMRVVAGRLRREGRAEEAMATYLKALARNPRSYGSTSNVAVNFHYFHDFENAELYYDRAIRLMPDERSARVWKALLYLAWTGDTAKAHATLPEGDCGYVAWSLHEATWRLCDEAQYYSGLSRYRETLGEGRASSIEAAQYFTTKAWLHNRSGETEQERAAYDSARAILEPRVREQSEDALLHSGLGIVYAGLGRREEAIREGRRGVELDPDDLFDQRVLNLARIYMMVGEYDLAVGQLETLPTDRGIVTAMWLGADRLWEPLRSHPRFQALLEKYE